MGVVQSRQAQLAAMVEQAQERLERASAAMDRAAGGFPLTRRSQVLSALGETINAANRLASAQLEQRVEQLVGEQLADNLEWTQGQLAALEQVVAALKTAARQLNLAEPELVEELYRAHAGDVGASVREAISRADDILAWAGWKPEALAAHLLSVARHAFDALRSVTVEDVLKRRWDDRSAQQWVARLDDLAAGAWNLDRALLPGGGNNLASFLTLGVPEEATSIFANSGHTLVSTHDRERIIALRTVYGASFDTLRQAAQWKRAYESMVGSTLLHVLPATKPGAGKEAA
jgi:hypothetical protein